MMNAEIKTKWLQALRSGEYKQGIGALHNVAGNSYCCLGVLCDIYVKEHPDNDVRMTHDNGFESFFGEKDVVPTNIQLWADIEDGNPDIEYDNVGITIAELNDNGKTFEEIAILIEEQL
jgi:hypothetical protein